ncbi:hypothetical protein [Agrobacterium leguminum]|jgi:hypothetical protein|uniref:hypothetical protein n=1 Tax=Agrobacterium leguminum TaxID=2792015 RepID=UPI003CE53A0D
MEWLRHVLGLAKFYSAIENIERILTRESEFYPQVLEIPAIDRASQAAQLLGWAKITALNRLVIAFGLQVSDK